MSTYIRSAAGVLCLAVLILGVVAFDLACLRNAPLPGDSGVRPLLADEVARREQLRQREEAAHRRDEAKRHVAGEVIAGRRSLAEALELFRELDREWPENRPWPHAPAGVELSQDEWDGRGVLDSVRQVLADRPDEAAAVAGRLEQELQQLLAERKKRPPELVDTRAEQSR
jgi:hypothetical protein